MCSGNPLEGLQKSLVDPDDKGSWESAPSPKLLQYLRDVSGQSEKPTSVRVLLLGRDGVGKSKTLEALGTPVGFVDRLFGSKKLNDERSHTTCPLQFAMEMEWNKIKYRVLVVDPPV